MEHFFLLYLAIGAAAVLLAWGIHQAAVPVVASKAIAIALLAPVSFAVSRRLLP